jgi:threonine aldolase
MNQTVDLRSDTVTRPTAAMRRAMAEAEVGDDVYGEDPTVNRLQERAAELTGMEAALFVPSGSMGNLLAIKTWTKPGQEVICEQRAHVNQYELASMSAVAGVMPRPVAVEDGILRWRQIEAVLRPRMYLYSQTGLVTIENTHNLAGGTVAKPEVVLEVCEGAHGAGLPVHLDGARIFNAAVALGCSVAELTAGCDSVMFCLSKGLGAPVGSLLAGKKDFIAQARTYRKLLGGGMRQVGVLAAAGLVALEKSPKSLAEDHAHAKRLADELAEIPGVKINPAKVQTNIVIFDVEGTGRNAAEICSRLASEAVLASAFGSCAIRMVTHYDVDEAGIGRAVAAVARAAKNGRN